MQFPINIGFSIAEPTSNSPTYINPSQSLKTIAVSTGSQRWELSLTTKNLREAEFRQAWAFLNSLAGKATTFELYVPIFSKPLGVVSGLVQSLTSHAIGENVINPTNYTAVIGDFMRFAGHSKVYQVVDTAGSSVTIFPPLFKAVSAIEIITVANVPITVRLNSNISKLKVDIRKISKLKFKVIEAF